MNVVLVDDSPKIRRVLKSLLSDIQGLRIVGEADDAPEALELCRTMNPDVAVLDIQMPNGSGIDLLRQIKQIQPAPVVMMFTGMHQSQYRLACEKAGSDYYFVKPSDIDSLHEAMETLAGRASPQILCAEESKQLQ